MSQMLNAQSVKKIIDEAQSFVFQKVASADVNAMPGSEHDVAAPVVHADPEVKESMPPKGTSIEGAKPGQNDIPEQGKLDMDSNLVASVDKEPLISAKLANDLLSSVKTAGQSMYQIELTNDVMAKMAATVLSTQEGYNMVRQQLSKIAGANVADATYRVLEQQQGYNQGYADAVALIKRANDQMQAEAAVAGMGGAPVEEDITIEQVEAALQAEVAAGNLTEEAAMVIMQTILSGGAPADPAMMDPAMVDPAMMAAGPGMEVQASDMSDASEEEVIMALDDLVDAGEISKEEALDMLGIDPAEVAAEGAVEGEEVASLDEALQCLVESTPEEVAEAVKGEIIEGNITEEQGAAIAEYVNQAQTVVAEEKQAQAWNKVACVIARNRRRF